MFKFLNLSNAGTLVTSVLSRISDLAGSTLNTFDEVYENLNTIDSESIKKSDITYDSESETLSINLKEESEDV